jgi:hypothetical protein
VFDSSSLSLSNPPIVTCEDIFEKIKDVSKDMTMLKKYSIVKRRCDTKTDPSLIAMNLIEKNVELIKDDKNMKCNVEYK